MFLIDTITPSALRTPILFALAATLTACMQDIGSMNRSNFIEDQPFAAPKNISLSDRSAARLAVARRFAQTVPTTVAFSFGSSELSDTARANLRQQANFITAYPELTFYVVGHPDEAVVTQADKQLAQNRADVVATFLTSLGVPENQISKQYVNNEQDFRTWLGDGSAPRAVTEVYDFQVLTVPAVSDLTTRKI